MVEINKEAQDTEVKDTEVQETQDTEVKLTKKEREVATKNAIKAFNANIAGKDPYVPSSPTLDFNNYTPDSKLFIEVHGAITSAAPSVDENNVSKALDELDFIEKSQQWHQTRSTKIKISEKLTENEVGRPGLLDPLDGYNNESAFSITAVDKANTKERLEKLGNFVETEYEKSPDFDIYEFASQHPQNEVTEINGVVLSPEVHEYIEKVGQLEHIGQWPIQNEAYDVRAMGSIKDLRNSENFAARTEEVYEEVRADEGRPIESFDDLLATRDRIAFLMDSAVVNNHQGEDKQMRDIESERLTGYMKFNNLKNTTQLNRHMQLRQVEEEVLDNKLAKEFTDSLGDLNTQQEEYQLS